METKTIDYEKILSRFKGSDYDMRTWQNTPFKQEGYYYATDCSALVRFPLSVVEIDYPEGTAEKKYPDCARVFPESDANASLLNLVELEKKIALPLTEEYRVPERGCPECDAEGELECNLGHTHECEDCKGEGILPAKDPTGNMIPDTDCQVKINDKIFHYKYLQKLFLTAKDLGETTAVHTNTGTDTKSVFMLGDIEILLMPMRDFDPKLKRVIVEI